MLMPGKDSKMKSLLIGAIAAATLAVAVTASAQTPPAATGQQAAFMPGSLNASSGIPAKKARTAVKQPAKSAQTPPDSPPESKAADVSQAEPGRGPLSSVVTPGIDPDTNEGMYPQPVSDTRSAAK
jgi:hypothetical protein